MEELDIRPYGNIEKTPKWNTNVVKFENGMTQEQQRQTQADVSWKVVFSGLAEEKDYLEDFYDRHAGNVKKFYFTINGKKEIVKFANDTLKFNEVREAGVTVAYTTDVVLNKVKVKE